VTAPPAAGEVEVWTVRLDAETAPCALLDAGAAPYALLDDGERERAARLRDEGRRARFVAAHAALRAITGARLGRAPERLRFARGPFGKPELLDGDGLFVNLSHSDGIALVALAAAPVGVDVERWRSAAAATRIAERYFPPAEREAVAAAPAGPGAGGRAALFARLWTRKEACVKAEGARLGDGLSLPVRGGGLLAVHCAGGALTGTWRVADLTPARGYAGAVAVTGSRPFRIVVRSWQPPGGWERGDKSTSVGGLCPVYG
jgi:4'-phosphopantetheinyl transferase